MGAYEPLDLEYDRILPGGPEARLRQRLSALAIALVASILVSLCTAIYMTQVIPQQVRDQVTRATVKAAVHDCLTQHQGRNNANRERFAVRELLAFDSDIITATQANTDQTPAQRRRADQFFAMERARLDADLAVARRTIPGLPPKLSGGFDDLKPFLASLSQVTCSAETLLR